MATIVNLESVTDGLYCVRIKREYDSSTQTREFTKEGLKEYLEGLEEYCSNKGYEFIFNDNGLTSNRIKKQLAYVLDVHSDYDDRLWKYLSERYKNTPSSLLHKNDYEYKACFEAFKRSGAKVEYDSEYQAYSVWIHQDEEESFYKKLNFELPYFY